MILYMWLADIHANQENPNQLQVTLLLELVVTNVYILLKREGYFLRFQTFQQYLNCSVTVASMTCAKVHLIVFSTSVKAL